MKKKHIFYTEAAYFIGLALLALGCSLMTRADFGLSMVVSPAYILHLAVERYFSFFSFGMAEYTLQAVLLIAMICVLRRFKLSYLFSFATAVFYGFVLDGFLFLVPKISADSYALRVLFYCIGMPATSAGVAVILKTYISPEVYELIIKEVTARFGFSLSRFKTCYDCVSCAVSIAMSLALFGRLEGVGLGTVVCAFVNGFLIGAFTELLDKCFDFKDGLKLRKYFE